MALKQIRIGSLQNIHQYDNVGYDSAVETDEPIKAGPPVDPNDVVRLSELASFVSGPAGATDSNLAEFDGITGKVLKDGGLSHAAVAAAIGSSHAQNTDTDLGALGAKNPPIDADKVIYRDSTAGDGLVTSTWLQIKAFLKTYFDGLYEILGTSATHSALSTGIHGVGAGTVAEVADIATDGNLSAAAQDAITKRHTQGTDTALGGLGTKNPPIDADKAIYRDSAAADALVTSTWAQVKAFLKTYFDGLYEILGATATHSALTTGVHGVGGGTVAEVADIAVDANLSAAAQAAIAASHARSHAISSTSDHSDVNLAAISDNDLMQWDDPTSKWLPKSIAEVILGQNINPGPVTIGTVETWDYAAAIADDGTVALPTIAANYAAKVEVIISSVGVIDANAIFMIDSTGTVTPQVDSGNCVYNVDTDVKLCIGTAAAQNPLTIKYRLGSAVAKIMITMKYVKA